MHLYFRFLLIDYVCYVSFFILIGKVCHGTPIHPQKMNSDVSYMKDQFNIYLKTNDDFLFFYFFIFQGAIL